MSGNLQDHAASGSAYVNDTSAHAVEFFGFTPVADTVIAAITAAKKDIDVTSAGSENDIVGDTLPAGMYFPISGSSITLTSGSVLLHKKIGR